MIAGKYLFCLTLLVFSVTARASEKKTLKISAQSIPYFLDSETQGGFVRVTEEIARRLNIKIEYELYPNYRALDVFKKKKALILLPGSHPKLKDYPYYESETIFTKDIYIFSKQPEKFASLKDLESRRVGVTLGYTYPNLSAVKGVDVQTAPSDESNLLKLQHDRLDAFLGEAVSINEAIKRAGLFGIKPATKSLTSEPIFYAFQKNAEGKLWSEKFNEVIRALKKSGQLGKILHGK